MTRPPVSPSVKLPPFQQLLDAHGRDVHRFLLSLVGPTAADDCYQETWLAALRAYPRLRSASNLRSWIFTVAHHKAIDHIRSRARGPVPVAEVDAGATGPPEPRDDDVWRLVRSLPNKQRAAIALKFVADAPYAEISAVMGTSEQAARRNVHEGLKRLRMEYQR